MVGHIAFITDRMEETIGFYQLLLGFRKAFDLKNSEGNPWIEYLMDDEGSFIELFYADSAISAGGAEKSGCYSHFCLEVANIEDIVQRAENCGIPLYKPLKTGLDKNRQCWFRDPNGLLVEIMEMDESSPQMRLRKERK